ncbi:transposase [bacterium]|nr:transposase [bacterium]
MLLPYALKITPTDVVRHFLNILSSVVNERNCIVPVYCFMPDHQHMILTGTTGDSNILETMAGYKQKTGYWFSKNSPEISWQKDFFDHIIRKETDLQKQVFYILENPVRKGLVSSWEEYPAKGSIGCNLEDVLNGNF